MSNVHPGAQASAPPAKPSVSQVAPPRLKPSHSSPGSMVPLPQKAVPLTAGVQSSFALNVETVWLPNWSVADWLAIGVAGAGHFSL